MRLTFSETMRGTLRAGGDDRPVEFTVTARSEGRGYFALEGTGKAPPWSEGPVQGSLYVSLFGRERCIRYRVGLPGGFVIAGEKTPSLLRPLHSMTFLPVKLLDAKGNAVATGTMTFALRELPQFLLSTLAVGHHSRAHS